MSRPPLLVFGLSGQLGDAMREHGLPMAALAVSRRAQPQSDAGVQWQSGALDTFNDAQAFDAVLSLGPLDAFAAAVAAGRVRGGRVVAFGSTSLGTKQHSPDPAERDTAARLAAAESALFAACAARGTPCTVLRPTLIWGRGRDATVSQIVRLARTWPVLPLPIDAPGLRQPVHTADLAALAGGLLTTPEPVTGAFDLPGGERVAYGAMLAKAVRTGAPRCSILPLPWPWVAALGHAHSGLRGRVSRLGQDLVFDGAKAREHWGWAPRGFAPRSEDFPSV